MRAVIQARIRDTYTGGAVGNPGQALIAEPSCGGSEEAIGNGRYTVIVFQIRGSGTPNGNGERPELEQEGARLAVVTDAYDESQRVAAERVRRLFSTECELKTVSVMSAPEGIFASEEENGGHWHRRKDSVRGARIAVRTEGKIIFVNPADVRMIEAQGNYVLLHTASRAHSLRESISNVAEKLEPYGFVRIHRSTIVNASLVEEIRTSPSGEIRLCLKGSNKEYSVSRRYRGALKSIAPCWI
jgi:uncharacterized protein YlzI (FlbEa/FlbD family)